MRNLLGILAFANDSRVLLWDLYNEPGNIPAALQPQSMALLKLAFEWAREVNVSQPITSGIWSQKLKEFNDFQVANSDVISFHCYKNAELTQACIDSLRPLNRPLICTEYMARKHGSTFQTIMPIFKKEKVMAINWGFVAGKTNTIFAWDEKMPDKIEPCVMCAGALFWSQIGRVVFGAWDEKRGASTVGKSLYHPKTQVSGGVLESECSTILKDFFIDKRH